MLNLDTLKDRLGSVPVVLPDGTTVPARAITAHEDRLMRKAVPAPLPPRVKDPGKGSAAPKVADHEDPAYSREMNQWYTRQSVMRLAVALDIGVKGQPWDPDFTVEQAAAWLTAADDLMARTFSKAWLDTALDGYSNLNLANAVTEAGEGNSGSGSATAD